MSEEEKGPLGVAAVYVDQEGRIITSVSDFNCDGYGGCTLYESQRMRAKRKLAVAVVRAYCSDVVVNALEAYDCEQIVAKLKGKMTFISIGHQSEE